MGGEATPVGSLGEGVAATPPPIPGILPEQEQAMQKTEPGFISTGNKGFHIRFSNGFSVSVQWGNINYCANERSLVDPMSEKHYECYNAEVLVCGPNYSDIEFSNEANPRGWQSPEDVAQMLIRVASWPPDESEYPPNVQRKVP